MAQWYLPLPANAGDARDEDSIPGSGRAPGEGNGNPRQYSCLGNPTDRGAWWAMVKRLGHDLMNKQEQYTDKNGYISGLI